jgi:hypothetical protein
VIERVFAARDRQKSLQIIDDHASIWERVIGTRGYTGKRAFNSLSMFNNLFDTGSTAEVDAEESLDEGLLDQLEGSV